MRHVGSGSGLVAHHRAFSSFSQISASMRRNWMSRTSKGTATEPASTIAVGADLAHTVAKG